MVQVPFSSPKIQHTYHDTQLELFYNLNPIFVLMVNRGRSFKEWSHVRFVIQPDGRGEAARDKCRDAATTRDSFLDWSGRKFVEEERCDWWWRRRPPELPIDGALSLHRNIISPKISLNKYSMFDVICRMVELIAVQLLQTNNAQGHVEQHH